MIAQTLYDWFADTLSRYNKPWEAVIFMVGDNCLVNQWIGRKVRAAPLVICACRVFNLALKGFLAKEKEVLLAKVCAFMKRLSILKDRALLRKGSRLASVIRSETRWYSPFAVIDRYSLIDTCIHSLDYASLAAHGLDAYLLSRRDNDKAIAMFDALGRLEGVT